VWTIVRIGIFRFNVWDIAGLRKHHCLASTCPVHSFSYSNYTKSIHSTTPISALNILEYPLVI
jgi:hypothetical protein